MTAMIAPIPPARVVYPDTDGLPMAENTLQFDWITTIKHGLDYLFADNPDVFVAGDLFWYPLEGHPEICVAPDVMVAFGRPKGARLSYLQWEEGGIPPQVVFEVLSPGNRVGEMVRKFEFYRRHGVEEYYIYNPDPQHLELSGFMRKDDDLIEVPRMDGHISQRLQIKFEMGYDGLRILRPDGRPVETYIEGLSRADLERQRANEERKRADEERKRADGEHKRADELRERAERAERRADDAIERADRLRAELERFRRERQE